MKHSLVIQGPNSPTIIAHRQAHDPLLLLIALPLLNIHPLFHAQHVHSFNGELFIQHFRLQQIL